LVTDDVEFGGEDNVAPVEVSGGNELAKTVEIAAGEFEEIEVDALVDGGGGGPVNGFDELTDHHMFRRWE
jgi:hypothetical protein